MAGANTWRMPPQPASPPQQSLHLPGFQSRSHMIAVPLDYSDPNSPRLQVHARVLTAPGGENRPHLVFLQGGPGFEAPRPDGYPLYPGQTQSALDPAWLQPALDNYQVVLLDQRGTGLSTPPTRAEEWVTEDQVAYFRHLRADNIVRDCESLREYLGIEKWTVLGQSFGGFTTLTYLSLHPESVAAGIITGGLCPVGRHIDEVYSATWATMREKTLAFYRRYPHVRARISELMEYAADGQIRTAARDTVSVERLQTLGWALGAHPGQEHLLWLIEQDHRSPAFIHDLEAFLPFKGRNPLYAVLHESSYADGGPTNWSAHRTKPADFSADPTLLAGEHIHPGLFTEHAELSVYADAADVLAQENWPRIFSEDVLAQCQVPVAAAVYAEDAYVDMRLSLETAKLLPDSRVWVTNAYEHNGLRADVNVLRRLIAMAQDRR